MAPRAEIGADPLMMLVERAEHRAQRSSVPSVANPGRISPQRGDCPLWQLEVQVGGLWLLIRMLICEF